MEKFMLFWTVMIVASIVLELLTVSIIGVWFAVGSIAGLVLSALNFPFVVQAIVSIVVSVISLLAFYPILKDKIKIKRTNVDAVLGKTAMLVEPILFNAHGKVNLNGVIWTAMSDTLIEEANVPVKIIAIEGNKLLVTRLISKESQTSE